VGQALFYSGIQRCSNAAAKLFIHIFPNGVDKSRSAAHRNTDRLVDFPRIRRISCGKSKHNRKQCLRYWRSRGSTTWCLICQECQRSFRHSHPLWLEPSRCFLEALPASIQPGK